FLIAAAHLSCSLAAMRPAWTHGTGDAGAYGPWSAGWHGRARAARKKAGKRPADPTRSDPWCRRRARKNSCAAVPVAHGPAGWARRRGQELARVREETPPGVVEFHAAGAPDEQLLAERPLQPRNPLGQGLGQVQSAPATFADNRGL